MEEIKTSDSRSEDGYTMVELLAVMVILVLIAGFVAPQVMGYLGKAKRDAALVQIENLTGALDLYYLDNGSYPSTDEGLSALVVKPAGQQSWNGPYVRKASSLTDPWGEPYQYTFPGVKAAFDLYSLGADKKQGGQGDNSDISNSE